jgi:hypothetical protein
MEGQVFPEKKNDFDSLDLGELRLPQPKDSLKIKGSIPFWGN